MNHPKRRITLIVLVFTVVSPLYISSQVNLKTGYNISLLADTGLDGLMHEFNLTQGYSQPFRQLRWLHGIEAGLRTKRGLHAFEFTYQSAYQRMRAGGVTSGAEERFTDKINFGVQSAAAGYQVAGDRFGAGVDFVFQWYRTKAILASVSREWRDVQNHTALRWSLLLTFPGSSGVDMAVQPYWVMPFDSYDLLPLRDFLVPESNYQTDRWYRFGLTVMFYNGR